MFRRNYKNAGDRTREVQLCRLSGSTATLQCAWFGNLKAGNILFQDASGGHYLYVMILDLKIIS